MNGKELIGTGLRLGPPVRRFEPHEPALLRLAWHSSARHRLFRTSRHELGILNTQLAAPVA